METTRGAIAGGRRALFLVAAACALAILLTSSAAASAPKQYLLKHPKREHCRAHFTKRVERVKVKPHTFAKKTFCVPIPVAVKKPVVVVPPAPPAPAPKPVEEPKIVATTTSLEVGPAEECKRDQQEFSFEQVCFFEVVASVTSAQGVALSPPVFTFTNESEPGKTWTVTPAKPSFRLEITAAKSGLGATVTSAAIKSPIFQTIGSTSMGLGNWAISAGFAGNSAFAASQSSSHTLVLLLS